MYYAIFGKIRDRVTLDIYKSIEDETEFLEGFIIDNEDDLQYFIAKIERDYPELLLDTLPTSDYWIN